MPKSKLLKYQTAIAQSLKQAWEEAGLRQDQAAKRLKRSQSYISKIEWQSGSSRFATNETIGPV
jgi:predicted transcriptional regulator